MAASVLAEYLADDPILMWALDESTGARFRDLDQAANHANMSAITTFMKGPVAGTTAPILLGPGVNSSANRDASVGPINSTGWTHSTSLPFGSMACTMEVWAYPTFAVGATYGCLLAYVFQNGGGNTHRVFSLSAAASAASCFTDGWNAGNNRSWTTNYTPNRWQHFVFTYAGGAGACIFYRDAVADTTSSFTLNTTVNPDRVRAGLRSDDARATSYFAGGLALAAIYPTALSQSRIQAHYDAVRQSSVVIG